MGKGWGRVLTCPNCGGRIVSCNFEYTDQYCMNCNFEVDQKGRWHNYKDKK